MSHIAKHALLKTAIVVALFPLILSGCGNKEEATTEAAAPEATVAAGSEDATCSTGKFADIKLNYQLPNSKKKYNFSHFSNFDFVPFAKLDKCYQFSAAVTMFGSLLRASTFINNMGWNEIITMAEGASGEDDLLQKEFISLVQQAKSLYLKIKKKKNGTVQW